MAGTAPNWRATALAQGFGQLWGSLAVPSASARLTLATDGTPDATANPNAFHFGVTDKGSKLMIKASQQKFEADEFKNPLITIVDKVEMGISASLLAITDMDVMKRLLYGVGTYSTASGYKQITVGVSAITYESTALIFPLIEDSTKFGVFHLYSAMNDSGVEWEQARSTRGATPVNFVGYDLTTRAVTDTVGNYWKQIA